MLSIPRVRAPVLLAQGTFPGQVKQNGDVKEHKNPTEPKTKIKPKMPKTKGKIFCQKESFGQKKLICIRVWIGAKA